MQVSQILSKFNATKRSPLGTYSPVKDSTVFYIPYFREDVYSKIAHSLLVKMPPDVLKLQELFQGLKAIYCADRLTIDMAGHNQKAFYLHNHSHITYSYCIYNDYSSARGVDLDHIYLSYKKCLAYCVGYNLSHNYKPNPYIKIWLRYAKTTLTKNTKAVKQLQYYMDHYLCI